jgi:hypothetical protein
MAIVIPPAIVDALVSGAASAAIGGLSQGTGILSAINSALGLVKAPASAAASGTAPVITPSSQALSMPATAWSKLSPDVQSIAANPQGIHLTAG